MIGNIRKDIRCTPAMLTSTLVGLTLDPLKGGKIPEETWESVVGSVLAALRNLDITGPGLKWNCADGFPN